ncbi:hypothetical protein IH980_05445 [Patescibacteria group bacterium]|nr:hypothetical protein [Patescibacteria group bacterium]
MQELLTQYPWLIPALQLWTIPWKGIALWIAARREDKRWFIALLIFQTAGILEIIYIFFIAKHKFQFLEKRKRK